MLAALAIIIAGEMPQKPGEASNSHSADAPKLTVVGCLVRTDTSAWRSGTSGNTPAASSEKVSSGFSLKDALEWTDAKPPTGPVRTRSEREFEVVSEGDIDLGDHQDRQVVIKGTFIGGMRVPTAAVGTSGSTDARIDRPYAPEGRVLRVESIQSLSDTCPPRY
jgi:hypothetical protein